MKQITIPIADSLDDDTVVKVTRILQTLAATEWAMLLKFYASAEYLVRCKGDSVEVVATVRK